MRKWVWINWWENENLRHPVWTNKNTAFFSHQNKLPLSIGVEAFEFLKTAQRGQAVWGHIGRGVFLAGVIALRRKKWKKNLIPHPLLPFFVFYYVFLLALLALQDSCFATKRGAVRYQGLHAYGVHSWVNFIQGWFHRSGCLRESKCDWSLFSVHFILIQ